MKTRASWPHMVAAVAITAAFLLFADAPDAQPVSLTAQLPQGFQKDPYVVELVQLIGLWNSKDLELPPRAVVVEQVRAGTELAVKAKSYPYQTSAWSKGMVEQASALPETLQPRTTISDPAALVLISLFIKGLDEYKKQVPLSQVRPQLQTPLFLILARAQELTKQTQIDAETMIRATLAWWTTVWPFCDKATPSKTTS